MRKLALLLSVMIAGAHAAPAPEANLKKWQDDKGVWHYGDSQTISPDAVTNSAAEAYRRGDYAAAFEE